MKLTAKLFFFGLILVATFLLSGWQRGAFYSQNVASGSCSPTSGHDYTTVFPNTENPLSECSSWTNGAQSPTLSWTNMRSTPNFAFGTEAAVHTDLDDSVAKVNGTWGNDQEMWGTVVAPTLANTDKELELRMRLTFGAASITGYEIQMTGFQSTAANCNLEAIRWNGPLNNFTTLTKTTPITGANVCLPTGTVTRVTMLGSNIAVYVNGVLALTATDATYASGAPGIGTFILSGGGLANDFGFSSFTATDTPIAFVQSKANNVATSGTTVAATMAANTTTGRNIWCAGYWADTGRTATVSDSANGTYTPSPNGPTNGAGGLSAYRAQTFWKTNITGAATPAITLTLSGGAASIDRALACHEFRGPTVIDQDPAVKSGSGTTMTSNNATITAAHEYLAGFCVAAGSFSGQPATAVWAQRESANFGVNLSADQVSTAINTYQMSAIQGPSSNFLCGIDTFK